MCRLDWLVPCHADPQLIALQPYGSSMTSSCGESDMMMYTSKVLDSPGKVIGSSLLKHHRQCKAWTMSSETKA